MKTSIKIVSLITILPALIMLAYCNNTINMNDIQVNIENNSNDTQFVELFDTVNSEAERLPPVPYISQTENTMGSGFHGGYLGQSFTATKNTSKYRIRAM